MGELAGLSWAHKEDI